MCVQLSAALRQSDSHKSNCLAGSVKFAQIVPLADGALLEASNCIAGQLKVLLGLLLV